MFKLNIEMCIIITRRMLHIGACYQLSSSDCCAAGWHTEDADSDGLTRSNFHIHVHCSIVAWDHPGAKRVGRTI